MVYERPSADVRSAESLQAYPGPSLSLLHCMKYISITIVHARGHSHSNLASHALLMLAPAAQLSSRTYDTVQGTIHCLGLSSHNESNSALNSTIICHEWA